MRLWPEHASVLMEVLQGEYAMDIPEPNLIFDLGANLGYASIYFAFKYPRAKIYAFEPDPRTFKKLCRNTRWFKRIFSLPFAISDHDGFASFYVSNSSISSSLIQTRKSTGKVQVPCFSLSTLCRQYGTPELVKFDVEGAESGIFSSFDTESVPYYVGEHHEDLTRMSTDAFGSLFKNKRIQSTALLPYRTLVRATTV